LALSLILSALSQIARALLCASLTLQHMSTIHSHFSSWFIMYNFSSMPMVFHPLCTWTVLDDADFLHFSLMLVRNANAVEEEIM